MESILLCNKFFKRGNLVFVWFVVLSCMVPFSFGANGMSPTAQSQQPQKFVKGSPEAVVDTLMRFDFLGGQRQNPDTYPQWFPLTTAGEPEAKAEVTPYWACYGVTPVVNSYKILGREQLSRDKLRILVEVDLRAFIAYPSSLKKIDKCYWPELGMSVLDKVSGTAYALQHPMNEAAFLRLIGDEHVVAEVLSKRVSGKDARELILVKKSRRTWQFKVDVVNQNMKWLVDTDSLFVPHRSLLDCVKNFKNDLNQLRDDIEICAGRRKPKNDSYFDKDVRCLPKTNPEKDLIEITNQLEILEKIREELK